MAGRELTVEGEETWAGCELGLALTCVGALRALGAGLGLGFGAGDGFGVGAGSGVTEGAVVAGGGVVGVVSVSARAGAAPAEA